MSSAFLGHFGPFPVLKFGVGEEKTAANRGIRICAGALEGRVGFETTTPGLQVRDPSDAPATQPAPLGIGDDVSIDQANLPGKQATALRRPSLRMHW